MPEAITLVATDKVHASTTCIDFTPTCKRLDNSYTLAICASKSGQRLCNHRTATTIQSIPNSEPLLGPSNDHTYFLSGETKIFCPLVVFFVLGKLQCCSSSSLSCSFHSTCTKRKCEQRSHCRFRGLHSQRFSVNSSKKKRMSIVQALAGPSIRTGSLFSALGICKFSRQWLRKGSNATSLRCSGTSALWNESWKIALCGRPMNWLLAKHSAWLFFGLCTCSIAAGTGTFLGPPALAEPLVERADKEELASSGGPVIMASHGKQVLTDYSVIGIPGDGRCLFRAVAHGAHVRKGDGAPSESVQRESADVLRRKVVDELQRRRAETEWFIEGNFDSYTRRMRQPHVWGGEPELLMASHVLRIPITVYMFEQRSKGLISIAEYGQEYAKENPVPIRVLYHGFGHYDALQLPSNET